MRAMSILVLALVGLPFASSSPCGAPIVPAPAPEGPGVMIAEAAPRRAEMVDCDGVSHGAQAATGAVVAAAGVTWLVF